MYTKHIIDSQPKPIKLEGFIPGMGGKSKTETETNIDKSMVVNSLTKVTTNAAQNINNESKQQFATFVLQKNTQEIDGLVCGGDMTMELVSANDAKVEADVEMTIKTTNDLNADITAGVSNSILSETADGAGGIDDMLATLDGAFEEIGATARDAINGLTGRDSETSTKMNIDQSQTINMDNIIEKNLNSEINDSSVQEAINNMKQSNNQTVKNALSGGNCNIKALATNDIDAIFNAVFTTEKMNKISTKIVDEIAQEFEKIDSDAGLLGEAGEALATAMVGAGQGIDLATDNVADVANNVVDEVGETSRFAIGSFTSGPVLSVVGLIVVLMMCAAAAYFMMMSDGANNAPIPFKKK